MFNRRASHKKPTEDLYKNFKASHPEVGHAQSHLPQQHGTTNAQNHMDDSQAAHDHHQDAQDVKPVDPTPRGFNDLWAFGPTGLTPGDHNFNLFGNVGYYPPTPSGNGSSVNNIMNYGSSNHPNMSTFGGMGLSTPLSMPTSEAALAAGQRDFHGFENHIPQHMSQSQFNNIDPFHVPQQRSFPPHHFQHAQQPLDFEGPGGESPIDDIGIDLGTSHKDHSPHMLFRPQSMSTNVPQTSTYSTGEKFRYHVTLNAPTAMVAHADEIPITYLNKGQAYTLNVVDTQAQTSHRTRRYRTFVRISFQDESQRQKPAQCWQLWKEGRGSNEAHHRGGRLQAVEYVDPTQSGAQNDPTRPHYELESSSFDGFCIIWSPPLGGADCPISVRFNFLSTDFSHSKGVKGIPVRLCAKTTLLDEGDNMQSNMSTSEVSYCMVKLFRDHGAERKLSNDVAHVKKTIEKLNQQIAQIESGLRDFGKRKRSGSVAKANLDSRGPGKIIKHRRTWSMSSVTSNGGRGSAEEDLHRKLVALQDRFSSTRPASILHLRGDEGDDPDASPVAMTAEPGGLTVPELLKNESTETATSWEQPVSDAEPISAVVSPTPSNKSFTANRKDSSMQQNTPLSSIPRSGSEEWRNHPQTATMDLLPTIQERPPTGSPTQIQTRSPRTGAGKGPVIEVCGIDPSYTPPTERPVKPIACFYVLPRIEGQAPTDGFYRAIYLTRRTIKDFVNALAVKCGLEPTLVVRIIRTPQNSNMEVLFDDDCIRELPEGQAITAKFQRIQQESLKREWDAGPTDVQCDGDLSSQKNVSENGYQLVLQY